MTGTEGLVSLVQMGALEFHAWGASAADVEQPDRIVIDLDPAPDVPFARVIAAAKRCASGCGSSDSRRS